MDANQKFKALVIENEPDVPEGVINFCNQMIMEGVVEYVTYLKEARNMPDGELQMEIAMHDCIIIKSTWMYKDQLEKFVKFFSNVTRKTYTFFIWEFPKWVDDWKRMDEDGYIYEEEFTAINVFFRDLELVLKQHVVYWISETDGKRRLYNPST